MVVRTRDEQLTEAPLWQHHNLAELPGYETKLRFGEFGDFRGFARKRSTIDGLIGVSRALPEGCCLGGVTRDALPSSLRPRLFWHAVDAIEIVFRWNSRR